jgi:murein DD-endopeptidase MepM/ murein hydrolase activator NlpD
MAWTTTREGRASRWRSACLFATAAIAVSGFLAVPAEAQVKPPAKPQFRSTKAAPKADPSDAHADQLNAKWLSEHNQGVEKSADAKPVPSDEERFSSIPAMAPVGNGSRALVNDSVKLIKASTTDAAFKQVPGGASLPALKEVAAAFSGFSPTSGAKVELIQGRTADGQTRPLYVALGDAKKKQTFWWFAPSDQPEGWFDDHGKRLGGTALADPKPDSRISSPFGRRTYYGRSTSTAFHNGIDFEGKYGEAIYAAADGTINHMNWYFNYGRTVKISHADNFETLYAHMSKFATGIGPGSHVKKGDLIGYVGSTGRSTGPHLHFSAIVNGQFVDPQPYLSENGNGQLGADALVSFRKWQEDIRVAATPKKSSAHQGPYGGLQGGENWTRNPFESAPLGNNKM